MGGASGIGAATAALFAAEGCRIALLDRDAPSLDRVARGLPAVPAAIDVTDEAAIHEGVRRACDAMGGLDGVVNAAGVLAHGRLDETAVPDWERVLTVNLTEPFLVARAALPLLRRASGSTIVNVASGLGLRPMPGYGAYAAAKAGLIALTHVLAAEFAPAIRVDAGCSGAVLTSMTQALYAEPDALRTAEGLYALRRLGTPAEVAQAILCLTSAASSYVTGSALAVDGGRTFH